MITLGSLFDGIGGFPLVGMNHGIKPIWASEIEPFPIKVTQTRIPGMWHYGDITKINGEEIEPVEIITGGSPCQDLSVAGKRAGLAGKRSGLFMEQVRIVREMRENERRNGRSGKSIRPRFMVWENVPGAFSSNKGEDFRAVLEETARIADETVVIPQPTKGKWLTSGCIMGNGWSITWRVLDAQYWGVPQRRRRIFLVADFGGETAPEILFKRESMCRNTQAGREERKGTAAVTERSIGKAIGFSGKNSATLNLCPSEELSPTLRSTAETHVMTTYGFDSYNQTVAREVINPLRSASGGDTKPMVAVTSFDNTHVPAAIIDCTPNGIAGTMSRKWAKGTGGPAGDEHYNLVTQSYSVRRLTPLECERLQGYPDSWTHIDGASDSAMYKALGNSVAIPCVEYVLKGIIDVVNSTYKG